MRYEDWMELGNRVVDMVDDAVATKDFSRLSENVRQTVSDGLDRISDHLQGSSDQAGAGGNGDTYRGSGSGSTYQGSGNGATYRGTGTGGRADGGSTTSRGSGNGSGNTTYRGNGNGSGNRTGGSNATYRGSGSGTTNQRNGNGATYRGTGTGGTSGGRTSGSASGGNRYYRPEGGGSSASQHRPPAGYADRYLNVNLKRLGSLVVAACGVCVAGFSVLIFLALLWDIVMYGWYAGAGISLAFFLIVAIAAAVIGIRGTGTYKRSGRFRQYIGQLKDRTYCTVQELAVMLGKSERFVRLDLKRMIRSGWFLQGHLDRKETCLIVTDETYRLYEQSMHQSENARQEQEQQKERVRRQDEALPEEVRSMIRTGQGYVEEIKRCNDEIPGVEISEKISRIQMLVERIFQRVKEQPELAGDLRKFMEYYLPTTVKLLKAYAELDRQPVQGENITSGKAEIEKTLDTLNLAYEKLLDSLFEDTAWDVATDISVLQALLAQEGLTEPEMK